MKHGSLFSGIGGFDYASKLMGWENVFHCEWMEFPRKVLEYHFPESDSYIDICKTDFKKYANKIDILTGGFPCQPFSTAGKRKGTDDERYLWGEMLRAIQEIKPKFVIAENVYGITNIDGGMVFEQVCLDLENEGYEVQPFIIPASAKNAPHRRDRCWFIGVRNVADTLPIRLQQCKDGGKMGGRQEEVCRQGSELTDGVETNGTISDVTHTNGRGIQAREVREILGKSNRERQAGGFINDALQGDASDPLCQRLQRSLSSRINDKQRWDIQQRGEINKHIPKNRSEIQFQNFPTQSPICGRDDGLPTELDGITFSKWRAESIKGYGNAIVPQVALELFKVIERMNNEF